jgi:hypothetical protein
VTHRWSEIGEKGLDWLQALGRRTSADSVVAGSGLEAQLPLHRHLLSVVFAHPIHLIPVHRSRARWRLAGLERPRGKVGSPALLRSVSRRIRLFSLVYGSVSTATLWHRRGRPLANVALRNQLLLYGPAPVPCKTFKSLWTSAWRYSSHTSRLGGLRGTDKCAHHEDPGKWMRKVESDFYNSGCLITVIHPFVYLWIEHGRRQVTGDNRLESVLR